MSQQRDNSKQAVALDLPELLGRVDNDRGLLRELILIFKDEFPRLLNQLKECVVRRDMKSAADTCHTLKGMLSALSAIRATALVARLEVICHDGDAVGVAAPLKLLEAEVNGLLSELDLSSAAPV